MQKMQLGQEHTNALQVTNYSFNYAMTMSLIMMSSNYSSGLLISSLVWYFYYNLGIVWTNTIITPANEVRGGILFYTRPCICASDQLQIKPLGLFHWNLMWGYLWAIRSEVFFHFCNAHWLIKCIASHCIIIHKWHLQLHSAPWNNSHNSDTRILRGYHLWLPRNHCTSS
jgi:hypothetical protein